MSSKPVCTVRRASRFDLVALETLLKKGLDESGGLLPPHDWNHFYQAAISQIATGLVFVATEVDEANKRERIFGCLSLDIQGWTWTPKAQVLRSVHFYLLPEDRGKLMPDGKTAAWEALINAGEWLADEIGLPLIVEVMHQSGTDNRAAAKDELLKRKGLSYLGGTFYYAPKEKQAQAAE